MIKKVGKFILGYGISSGTYRGIVSFKHDKENILYTEKIGLQGANIALGIYLNTILFPVSMYTNIKRLEVNIRGLQEEKKKYWYNDIL